MVHLSCRHSLLVGNQARKKGAVMKWSLHFPLTRGCRYLYQQREMGEGSRSAAFPSCWQRFLISFQREAVWLELSMEQTEKATGSCLPDKANRSRSFASSLQGKMSNFELSLYQAAEDDTGNTSFLLRHRQVLWFPSERLHVFISEES